jgi:hypothetical protein
MLEQQQTQLVSGLRELYRRLQTGESWPGKPLKNVSGGHPLTHDILDRLDLLHSTNDTPIKHEGFEDDLSILQQRCVESTGSPIMKRKKSISEESEPGLTSDSSHGISSPARTMSFAESFAEKQSPTTPPQDIPYFQAPQLSPRTKYEQQPYHVNTVPTIAQKRGLDPMQLLQQNWQLQPNFSDQPMDIDMFPTSYAQTSFDSLLYNPYPVQGQDLMWGEMNDYINPNALQA